MAVGAAAPEPVARVLLVVWLEAPELAAAEQAVQVLLVAAGKQAARALRQLRNPRQDSAWPAASSQQSGSRI
jgi:hypothetical protein